VRGRRAEEDSERQRWTTLPYGRIEQADRKEALALEDGLGVRQLAKALSPWYVPMPELPMPPNGASWLITCQPQSLTETPPECVRRSSSSRSASSWLKQYSASGRGRR
jgi:hypothetical protein